MEHDDDEITINHNNCFNCTKVQNKINTTLKDIKRLQRKLVKLNERLNKCQHENNNEYQNQFENIDNFVEQEQEQEQEQEEEEEEVYQQECSIQIKIEPSSSPQRFSSSIPFPITTIIKTEPGVEEQGEQDILPLTSIKIEPKEEEEEFNTTIQQSIDAAVTIKEEDDINHKQIIKSESVSDDMDDDDDDDDDVEEEDEEEEEEAGDCYDNNDEVGGEDEITNHQESPATNNNNATFTYKCIQEFNCSASFYTIPKMYRHLVSVHNWKMFIQYCNICGLCFKTNSKKVKHVQKSHGFHCGLCKKKFVVEYYYLKHMKEEHKSPVHFSCSECGKSCTSKRSFMRHMKTQHVKKKKLIWPCNLCRKEFLSQQEQENHVIFVHRHECGKCGTIFTTYKSLDEHRAKQHGIRPPANRFPLRGPQKVRMLKKEEKRLKRLQKEGENEKAENEEENH